MQILTAQNHREYINLNVPEAFRPVAFYLLNGCYNNRDKYFDYNRSLIEINGKLMWCCTITLNQLAKKIKKSIATVKRAIKFLRDIGLLIIGKRNRRVSNQNAYTFRTLEATENDMREIKIRDKNALTEFKKSYLMQVQKTEKKLYMAQKDDAAVNASIKQHLGGDHWLTHWLTQQLNQQLPTRARYNKNENKIKKNKAPAMGRVTEAEASESANVIARHADATRQNADAITRSEIEVTETASVVSPADGIAASGGKLPEPKEAEVDVSSVQSPAFGAQGLPAKRAESPSGMTLQEKQAQFLAEMKRGRAERLPLETLRDIYERAKRFADESVIGVSFAYRAQLRYFEGIFRPDSEKQTI